jgi:leucine dehydrogenase
MEYVKMSTDSVAGLPESMGGGGDPSPVTAYGTYIGMKASAKKAYGSDSLKGKKIAIQGIGKVGMHLVELITKEGGIVSVSDINEGSLKHAVAEYGATVVNGDDIYGLDVDIFAPCALGAILNTKNINALNCDIIAGAANNQLAIEEEHGVMIKEKGLLYAPDFLINAGGLINVYSEVIGYNRENAMRDTENIYDTTLNIFNLADEQNIHTQKAATLLAQKRIDDILNVQSTY